MVLTATFLHSACIFPVEQQWRRLSQTEAREANIESDTEDDAEGDDCAGAWTDGETQGPQKTGQDALLYSPFNSSAEC